MAALRNSRVIAFISIYAFVLSSASAAERQGSQRSYTRAPKSSALPISSDTIRRSDSEARPEQIHLSFAGPGAVSISWVTHAQDVQATASLPHHPRQGVLQSWWRAAQSLTMHRWLKGGASPSAGQGRSQLQTARRQTGPESGPQLADLSVLHHGHANVQSVDSPLDQGRQQQQQRQHLGRAEPRCDHLAHLEIMTIALYGSSPNITGDTATSAGLGSAAGTFSATGSHTCYVSAEYESGALHTVILGQDPQGPLLPSATYYYRVGANGPHGELSPVFSFNMTPEIGPSSLPYRLALVGDLGQTLDSATTLQHLVEVRPQSVLNVGDLSYADGYHPRWDTYGRLIQPSAAYVPWMNIEGNHEQELVGLDEKSWLAYELRFSATGGSSGSDTTMYYSYDIAVAHVIMIGSYADHDADSAQYAWLSQDLQKVDRSRTPWLIVGMHVPWYNSYFSHHGEGDDIREDLEELLFQYGVDLIFAGHVHSYERSRRVLRGQADPCGPIHVTIGDGGNREGAAIGWEEPQPPWSEVREPSFGMGVLEFADSRTASWQWYRNTQAPVRDIGDEVVFVRDPKCQHSRP